MEPMVNIAAKAARAAQQYLGQAIDRPDLLKALRPSSDYRTDLERDVELQIVDALQRAYPHHGIVGEQTGHHEGRDEYTWLVDAVEGIENLLNGHPHFATTITCSLRGQAIHAVVNDPLRHELFSASRGQGARLNDTRLRVNARTSMSQALLGCDLAGMAEDQNARQLQTMAALVDQGASFRMHGCPSLDFAYVAAGRLDGTWHLGLKGPQMPAGGLIVREAGGLVADLRGGQPEGAEGDLVAAAPKCFKPLLQAAARHLEPTGASGVPG